MAADPLRILHVIPAVAPRYGGPSELVIGVCRHAQLRGHQVTIVTSNANGQGTLPVALDDTVEYRGVPVRFFPRKLDEAFKYSPGMGPWLRERVADYQVVHIHAVFSWSTLVAGRTCLSAGIPYIVRPLGSLDPWSLNRRRRQKWLLMRMGLRRILEQADLVHYTSDLEMQKAEAALGLSNGHVVPNAVDVPDLSRDPVLPDLGIPRPFLLSLGRLHPKKRLERVIRSFAARVADSPLHLVIAGDGNPEYRESLKQLAADSGAASRIHFTGWTEGAAKEALLRHCEAFILISDNENFGIAAAEAMSFGKPVLVNTGVYLHPDISRHDAGWVIERDEELTSALLELGRGPVERKEKGANARQLVETYYGWDSVSTALEEMYQQCIPGSR